MVLDVDRLCMGCMQELEEGVGKCPHCGFDEGQNPPAPHQLPPRTILGGKYLIGKVLGEGGFGITYLGWDLNLDLKLAIKEYYPTGFVTRDSTASYTVTAFTGESTEFYLNGREKFVDEAKRLAKFYALPGIVSVKDFFQENGTAYIVMEFIDGETLKAYLRRMGGKLPVRQVIEMMQPLARSLGQVHRAGIIHRDISPDNIMLDSAGNLRLLDFGAARDFSGGERSLSVLLKPGYAPEEQYRTRGSQGPWTDVYALCATMYKAITGTAPLESLERLQEDTLKAPSALGIAMDPGPEAALMKGLAVFQKNRWPDMDSLFEALTQTAPASPTPAPAPPAPAPAARPAAPAAPARPSPPPAAAPKAPPRAAAPVSDPPGFIQWAQKKWGLLACAALALILIPFAISHFGNNDKATPAGPGSSQEERMRDTSSGGSASSSSKAPPSSSKASSTSKASSASSSSSSQAGGQAEGANAGRGYDDGYIRFSYPADWLPSTNKNGWPKITGIVEGDPYVLEVLDVTGDTTGDIFSYALSFLPETVIPGGVGSVSNTELGSYSAVLTGCLYEVGDNIGSFEEIRSMTIYAVTDGKMWVAISVGAPEMPEDGGGYDPAVFEPMLASLELLKAPDGSRAREGGASAAALKVSCQDTLEEVCRKLVSNTMIAMGMETDLLAFDTFHSDSPTEWLNNWIAQGAEFEYDVIITTLPIEDVKDKLDATGILYSATSVKLPDDSGTTKTATAITPSDLRESAQDIVKELF